MYQDEESIDIVGAVKLMDGLFLGDAICAEVSPFYLKVGENKIQIGYGVLKM